MGKLKKPLLYMIAIAIVTLLITSATGLPTQQVGQSDEITSFRITKLNKEAQVLQAPTQTVTQPFSMLEPSGRTNYAFPGLHPAFARNMGGKILAAYYDVDLDNIIWTFSTDDGENFDGGVYYDIGGDYPSIKLWDGQRFFGTHVTDFYDLNGGPTYVFEATDPANYDTYSIVYWDWSTYGWYGMIDADIACDSSQNEWEWGLSSYVTSTTYSVPPYTGYIDGPTVVYSDPDTEGSGWISWYWLNGCAHTDVDIDPVAKYIYAVYDWFNESVWKLLVRVKEFETVHQGSDTMYTIEGAGNLQYPAVAAYGDKVVILAQTDENGNNDIICLYSDNKFVTFQTSFVANSAEDEIYPDVRFDMDGNFVCTYVMGNNLYTLKSEDGGATWIDPGKGQVNSNDDVVVEEYKTSDLCEFGIKGMWEETGNEIWIGDVAAPSNLPPFTPTITGPTKLKPNRNYDFTFSTTDPDGDDIFYYVDWGDGTFTDWTASTGPLTLTHKWTEKDTFTIKCKAKDIYDAESDWGTLDVSTPRSRISMLRLLDIFPNAFPILRMLLGL
jgi:hypothetical protein